MELDPQVWGIDWHSDQHCIAREPSTCTNQHFPKHSMVEREEHTSLLGWQSCAHSKALGETGEFIFMENQAEFLCLWPSQSDKHSHPQILFNPLMQWYGHLCWVKEVPYLEVNLIQPPQTWWPRHLHSIQNSGLNLWACVLSQVHFCKLYTDSPTAAIWQWILSLTSHDELII